MKQVPTEEQIQERMPVWMALAELFLDGERSSDDLLQLARILNASGYTERELEEILRWEVYPVCAANLVSNAGVWGGWGEAWIRERISPRYNYRPRIYLPAFRWRLIQKDWTEIMSLMRDLRHKEGRIF